MNLLLRVSVLSILVTFISSETWVCNRGAEKRVDDIMAKLMTYGYSGRKYPVNREELKTYCEDQYKLITKVEEYKNQCLDTLSKQSVGVILFSMKNLINQYCKKNSKKIDDLLSATQCANSASNEFNKCNSNYIDTLLAAQNVPEKQRIPLTCCSYHKIFDCVHTRGSKVQGCTDKALDICEDYIKSHFESVLRLLCADYTDNSNKCDSLPTAPKKKRNQRRTKSFILPLVKLLKGFPEV